MQTETLREFVVLANYRNFRKAADQLHIAQPTLSNHITALERELGFKLFEREGGTRLTTAGARFYTTAQRVLDELSEGIDDARSLTDNNPPVRLQILGKDDSTLTKILVNIKTPFQVVPLDDSMQLITCLETGRADILATLCAPILLELVQDDKNSKYGCLPIGMMDASFLVSSTSPLAEKDSLYRKDLKDAEILLPYGNLYEWLRACPSEALGEDLNVKFMQDPSLPTGLDNIPLRGLGQRIMLQYRNAAHRVSRNQSDIVAIDQFEGKNWETMEYLIYRIDDPNPLVPALIEEVRALVGEVQDDTNGMILPRSRA